jgi:hypothetical protein
MEKEQQIITLFDKVVDAYVSAASDSVFNYGDDAWEDEVYDDPDYKYEVSRINTEAEEWRKELRDILHGNKGRGSQVGT